MAKASIKSGSQDTNNKCCNCCSCCGCIRRSYPHYDGVAKTSLILSYLAFFTSWVFFGTFAVSLVAWVMQQCLWCCRQKRSMMIATIVLTGVASLLQIGTGLFVTFAWKSRADRYDYDTDYVLYCEPFTFYYLVGNRSSDWCNETLYSTICFVAGVFWALSFGFLMYFYKSGRYAQLEKQLQKEICSIDDEEEQVVEP